MKQWYTAQEIAEMGIDCLPKTKMGIIKKAKIENWCSRPRSGRGGGREYNIASLPKVARDEIAKRAVSKISVNALVKAPEHALSSPKKSRKKDLTSLRASQREVMEARSVILDFIDTMVVIMRSKEKAIRHFIASVQTGTIDPKVKECLIKANGKANSDRTVSRATLFNWMSARSEGLSALAPVYTERFYVPEWARDFLELYQMPGKPSVPSVCKNNDTPALRRFGVSVFKKPVASCQKRRAHEQKRA